MNVFARSAVLARYPNAVARERNGLWRVGFYTLGPIGNMWGSLHGLDCASEPDAWEAALVEMDQPPKPKRPSDDDAEVVKKKFPAARAETNLATRWNIINGEPEEGKPLKKLNVFPTLTEKDAWFQSRRVAGL